MDGWMNGRMHRYLLLGRLGRQVVARLDKGAANGLKKRRYKLLPT